MSDESFAKVLEAAMEADQRQWEAAIRKLGIYLQSLEDRIAKLELKQAYLVEFQIRSAGGSRG